MHAFIEGRFQLDQSSKWNVATCYLLAFLKRSMSTRDLDSKMSTVEKGMHVVQFNRIQPNVHCVHSYSLHIYTALYLEVDLLGYLVSPVIISASNSLA